MAKKTRKKTKPTPASNVPGVRVRMYRQGLGDCFLITFDLGRDERHMLIDFGTLGAKSTKAKMPDVAADIATTTSKRLEILVATHAHQDHVSGFLSQRDVLKPFKIGNVWMGWTEDPSDPLAAKLGNIARSMRAAIADAYKLAPADGALRSKLEGILEFEGGVGAEGQLAMGATIAEALDILRRFPNTRLTYHSPGGPPVALPSIPGFRFYVLGPPRDEVKLASMGDHGSDELYGLASAVRAHADVSCAMDPETPFDSRFCHPLSAADDFYKAYAAKDEEYRRVDGQWMQAAADLAARLDDFRNNTSLALAIERIADGRVLLFPADAQEGNWLSWHDDIMKWKVEDSRGALHEVNAEDLLSRTVFYKVGHHGSHNATAKGKGLEIMRRNKELTAFIPVDREVALGKSPRGSWRMPAVALYRELLEACDGRVMRADVLWADDARNALRPDVERELERIATDEEWKKWRGVQTGVSNVRPTDLFIDYELK